MSRLRTPAGTATVSRPDGGTGLDATQYEALFASDLQYSFEPNGAEVQAAIAHTIRALGPRGCLERVAQEFGDHPDSAVARMRWARAAVSAMSASATPA